MAWQWSSEKTASLFWVLPMAILSSVCPMSSFSICPYFSAVSCFHGYRHSCLATPHHTLSMSHRSGQPLSLSDALTHTLVLLSRLPWRHFPYHAPDLMFWLGHVPTSGQVHCICLPAWPFLISFLAWRKFVSGLLHLSRPRGGLRFR